MKKLLLIVVTILSLYSCASVTIISNPYPTKIEGTQIDVYITNKPAVSYSEIAIIKSNDGISDKTNLNRIKKKALGLGADAIIITGNAGYSGSVDGGSKEGFCAVAVKYNE